MGEQMTVAEIAVRLAAGLMANAGGPIQHRPDTGWGWVNCDAQSAMELAAETAETLHAELAKRGHIAPDPAPVAGPEWAQAPKWAQWAAQDEDGAWWWYELQPEPVGDAHCGRPGKQAAIKHPNWRESLQRRPGGG